MRSDDPSDLTIKLSDEAYDDLVSKQNYTYDTFGEIQWQKYSGFINETFELLSIHPLNGQKRMDVPKKYRCIIVQKHIIIYRLDDKTMHVVRVLHSRMNFRYHF